MAQRARLLVAQTPIGVRRCGGALVAGRRSSFPVGVVYWPGRLSVVVKATLDYDGSLSEQEASLATKQRPFSLASPSQRKGATADELSSPTDLVAYKPDADVLVVGHCFAAKARERIDASIAVGDVQRSFSCVGTAVERRPLSGGYLREADGESESDPVGPVGPHDTGWDASFHQEENDPALMALVEQCEQAAADLDPLVGLAPEEESAPGEPKQDESPKEEPPEEGSEEESSRLEDESEGDELAWDELGWDDLDEPGPAVRSRGVSFAAAELRGDWIAADASIKMSGLRVGGGPSEVRLPGIRPHVVLETEAGSFALEMLCDTLLIDTDREQMSLVWRGQGPCSDSGDELRRLVVSMERDSALRPLSQVFRDLPRAAFCWALEPEALLNGEPAAGQDDPELRMAKLATWDTRPEPSMSMQQYAQVAAEMAAAAQQARPAVLERHDLDEDSWLLEERVWLETLGEAVATGNEAVAVQFGELFAKTKLELDARAKQEEG